MMSDIWDQSRVEQYINDEIEESLNLDYKAAGSLAKSDGKKKEITKDVSAMANSAGGILIYGIAEYQDKEREHLPEKIDPVDRTEYSKEWIEQVISNIQPRIDGIVIHPVSIDTSANDVVYVVEIPQGDTAHQAKDFRYYKRYNFESVMMSDYEIRDIMGRQQSAKIALEFRILIRTEHTNTNMFPSYDVLSRTQKHEPEAQLVFELYARMQNIGKVLAQYIEAFIELPCDMVYDHDEQFREYFNKPPKTIDIDEVCTFSRDNTVRDYIKGGGGMLGSPVEYGPARYVPILPGIKLTLDEFTLTSEFEDFDWGDRKINWTTHSDNASPHTGSVKITEVEIVDHRHLHPSDPDIHQIFD